MRRTVIGGSACPPAMIDAFERATTACARGARLGHDRDEPAGHGVHVQAQAPADDAVDERYALQAKQGRVVFGVDMKVVDEEGASCPGTAAAAVTCWCAATG
jgi:hypothetical protein